jgi:protein-disulfide isomerase
LEHGTAAAAVEQDIALGNQIGISATPTLFVNGHRLSGYRPEQIRTLVRELASAAQAVQEP